MTKIQFPSLPLMSRDEAQSAVEWLSAKTESSASTFFESGWMERALERIEELEDSEISLNCKIFDLCKETNELQICKTRLNPVEIASRLDQLREKIFSCPTPSTDRLQKELSDLKERWKHLYFQFVFPDAEELEKDSFQNNFFYRLKQQIALANPKTALQLQEYLASLQSQCQAAEEIFEGKGLEGYRSLPVALQKEIEGRLFEKRPGVSLKHLLQEPDGEILIAAAIMSSLSERLLQF